MYECHDGAVFLNKCESSTYFCGFGQCHNVLRSNTLTNTFPGPIVCNMQQFGYSQNKLCARPYLLAANCSVSNLLKFCGCKELLRNNKMSACNALPTPTPSKMNQNERGVCTQPRTTKVHKLLPCFEISVAMFHVLYQKHKTTKFQHICNFFASIGQRVAALAHYLHSCDHSVLCTQCDF